MSVRQLMALSIVLLATTGVLVAQEVTPHQLIIDMAMPDGQHDLHLIDVDTGQAVNLTNTPGTSEELPRWVDRDTLLYFDSHQFRLYLLDVRAEGATGEPRALAGDYSDIVDSSLEVSPNSNHIAYIGWTTRSEAFTAVLYVVDLPDGEPRPVVEAPGLKLLGWTQDSTQLLYANSTPINDQTRRDATYVIPVTGGNAELIRTDESAEDHLYSAQESRATGARLFVRDEMLYDAQGNALAGDVSTAAWSPDGRQIAYVTTFGTLAVTDAVGGRSRLVAQKPDAVLSSPYWSPDGMQIAVLLSYTGLETKLAVYNVDDQDEMYELSAPMPSWARPDWRP